MTPLQAKKRWMRKRLSEAKATRSEPYTAAPWVSPPKIVIEDSKTRTSHGHNRDQSNLQWKAYSDGSGKDEDVTAAAVSFNWNKAKRLGGAGLTMVVEALTNHCESADNA